MIRAQDYNITLNFNSVLCHSILVAWLTYCHNNIVQNVSIQLGKNVQNGETRRVETWSKFRDETETNETTHSETIHKQHHHTQNQLEIANCTQLLSGV